MDSIKTTAIDCFLHDLYYSRPMEHQITPEIAQAILKGERDYAATLSGMELARTEKTNVVHVDNLNENQRLGFDQYVRRIRGAS